MILTLADADGEADADTDADNADTDGADNGAEIDTDADVVADAHTNTDDTNAPCNDRDTPEVTRVESGWFVRMWLCGKRTGCGAWAQP